MSVREAIVPVIKRPMETIAALTALNTERADGAPDYRRAPHNIEAEQALLGAILINNEACDRVSGFLRAEDFFESVHARIYETAALLIRSGKLASPVTLKTFFEHDDSLSEIGGAAYLARLAAAATTIINAGAYGNTIHELATRRQLIELGTDLVTKAYDAPVDMAPRELIETTEQSLYVLAETSKYGSGFQSFGKALSAAVDMAANAYERDGGLSGLATGLCDLDAKLGGLQPCDLIILAGRPSMGKTSLATNIAYHIARGYRGERQADGSEESCDGGIVAFFSLEMSAEQLATRIISEQTEISSQRIRRGQIAEDEFKRLVTVSREIQSLPLFIDDTGGLSIAQLAARSRRLKRNRGLGLIVVDYLQLLTGSDRRSLEGRVQEVSQITNGLKALAKELGIPVLALSQLSRQVEQRDDKRPQLADLRESGSIEQDADVVMFIFREEYYLQRRQPRENTPEFFTWQDEMEKVTGQAEVIIGKQRHGPTGTVTLQFDANLTKFQNLARDENLPERFD